MLSKLVRVLRWVIAVPATAVAFILGFVLVALIWQHFGGFAGRAYTWSVAVGTMAGVLVGSFIAPPDQRRRASQLFVGAVFAVAAIPAIVSLVDHTFKVTNAFDVMGSLLGGGIILRLFYRITGTSTSASSQT